jgi:hypothetical protein
MQMSLVSFLMFFLFHQAVVAQTWRTEDLSFEFSSWQLPLTKDVLVNEVIHISPFEAPGREGTIHPPKFRIIMGYGSLSLFNALGTNEVAGLKREDAQKFIDDLHQQGKTEVDGAFIAGLTNIHAGKEFFVFFNLERMKHSAGYASRILAHEPLHMARLLITTIENPSIDYINDPWVNLTDSNEEYFAETLERIAAVCSDRFNQLTRLKSL